MTKQAKIEIYQASPSDYWVSYLEPVIGFPDAPWRRYDISMNLTEQEAVASANRRAFGTDYPIFRTSSPGTRSTGEKVHAEFSQTKGGREFIDSLQEQDIEGGI